MNSDQMINYAELGGQMPGQAMGMGQNSIFTQNNIDGISFGFSSLGGMGTSEMYGGVG